MARGGRPRSPRPSRGYPVCAIERGKEIRYYELAGWKPRRPIELLLSVTGLGGGSGSGLSVVPCEPGAPPVKIKGFVVPDGEGGDLGTMLQRAFTGGLGGFHPVVVALTGFHGAPMVFEYLRGAVGSPAVLTKHPDLVEGPSASAASPAALAVAANTSATLTAIRALEKIG